MLKTKGSSQLVFQLLYRNGQAAVSGQIDVPRYKDICLTKDSQDECDDLIEQVKKCEHPIQSDREGQDYIALHSLWVVSRRALNKLEDNDRAPWMPIMRQISAAIEPTRNKLIVISADLKKR